jgi:hypothetical protein
LIISRSEAMALQAAALGVVARNHPLPEPLIRALRVIDLQLQYIDHGVDSGEPNVKDAVEREGIGRGVPGLQTWMT